MGYEHLDIMATVYELESRMARGAWFDTIRAHPRTINLLKSSAARTDVLIPPYSTILGMELIPDPSIDIGILEFAVRKPAIVRWVEGERGVTP
jgi:hypothetical protein